MSPATCGRELNHNKSGLPTCSGLGKPYRHRPSELAKWSVVKKLLITADVVVGGARGSLLVASEWWSRHGHATKKQRDYESNILTIDEAREYCRFVGQGIEMARCQTSFIVCKLWTSLCVQYALRTTTSGCGADGQPLWKMVFSKIKGKQYSFYALDMASQPGLFFLSPEKALRFPTPSNGLFPRCCTRAIGLFSSIWDK